MKAKKIIASLTAFLFVFQTVAFSAPELIQTSFSSKEVSPVKLDIDVPRELGQIQKVYQSPTGTGVIIHIQDAHGNYEAQRNIRSVMRHLHEKYGVKLLLMEGADDKLNPALMNFFEDKGLNEKVADVLMKYGEFSGPEMFLLSADGSAAGYGIEATELYRKDVELFREVILGAEISKNYLESARGRVQVLESRIFSKDLRDFVKEWRKEQQERANLLNYVNVLAKQAEGLLSLDLKDPLNQDAYPAMLRVLKLKDLEATLDAKKIEAEKQELLAAIKDRVDAGLYEKLAGLSADKKLNKRENPRFVLEKIHEQVKGLDYGKYPHFSKYAAYLVFQAEIESEQLFKEAGILTDKIFEALAKTAEEKNLLGLIKDSVLLEKLFKLELSRAECLSVTSQKDAFAPVNFLERIVGMEKTKKNEAGDWSEAEKLFVSALEFYQVAQEREEHFIENAVNTMKKTGETRAVVVTGGFHAEGFETMVKDKGLSYILISPRISEIGNSQEIYLGAMLGKTDVSPVQLTADIKGTLTAETAKSQVMVATHSEPYERQVALWGAEQTSARRRFTGRVAEQVGQESGKVLALAASLGGPAVREAKVETPAVTAASLGAEKYVPRKREVLLFDPGYDLAVRNALDTTGVYVAPTPRSAEEVYALLEYAEREGLVLEIEAHLRGVDGAGSSLDLPEFQLKLTRRGVKNIPDIPSTPTLASMFSVKIRFEKASDPNVIEYVAPDYGITEAEPYRVKVVNEAGQVEGVRLVEKMREGKPAMQTPKGQKDGPAYVFANIFGLKGVRIVLDEMPPMALAGGMESSNAFNVALYMAASMLSGQNWSMADIFERSVADENTVFGGLTGGQGHLSSILGGAYRHTWLSGIKSTWKSVLKSILQFLLGWFMDVDKLINENVNRYAAFSEQLLAPEQVEHLSGHMALVQAGKTYERKADGSWGPKDSRSAGAINDIWTALLRMKDPVGVALHSSKLALAAIYTEELKKAAMATTEEEKRAALEKVAAAVNKYVDTRVALLERWDALAAQGKVEPRDPNTDYLGPARELIMKAREYGIAIMPLGAGGPGANNVAISPDKETLERFLREQGLEEVTDAKAQEMRSVIRGTTADGTALTGEHTLKGYMPFKMSSAPAKATSDWEKLGVKLPAQPMKVLYDEATGRFENIPAQAASLGAESKIGLTDPQEVQILDRAEYDRLMTYIAGKSGQIRAVLFDLDGTSTVADIDGTVEEKYRVRHEANIARLAQLASQKIIVAATTSRRPEVAVKYTDEIVSHANYEMHVEPNAGSSHVEVYYGPGTGANDTGLGTDIDDYTLVIPQNERELILQKLTQAGVVEASDSPLVEDLGYKIQISVPEGMDSYEFFKRVADVLEQAGILQMAWSPWSYKEYSPAVDSPFIPVNYLGGAEETTIAPSAGSKARDKEYFLSRHGLASDEALIIFNEPQFGRNDYPLAVSGGITVGEDPENLPSGVLSTKKAIGLTGLEAFAWILDTASKHQAFRQAVPPQAEVREAQSLGAEKYVPRKREVLLFDPGYDLAVRNALDTTGVYVAPTPRSAEEVYALLDYAKKEGLVLEIEAQLRGVDGAGSSLDLPEFQLKLTKRGVKNIPDIPSTPTLASMFSVKIRFEKASSPDVIEYIARDYGYYDAGEEPYLHLDEIYRSTGYRFKRNEPYQARVVNEAGEVVGIRLVEKVREGKKVMQTPNGQADAPAYVFANIFGLRGVRIVLDEMPPMALAGGMESSNAFNVALYMAASMLSGQNWSMADIFERSVADENTVFGGLTGGQGHLSSILGGAYRHTWLSGIKSTWKSVLKSILQFLLGWFMDVDKLINENVNRYAAFSEQLLAPEQVEHLSGHMALVQAGKTYARKADGSWGPKDNRSAGAINDIWTALLRMKDPVGVALHSSKLALAAIYTEELKKAAMATTEEEKRAALEKVAAAVNKYVDTRVALLERWDKLAARGKVEPRDSNTDYLGPARELIMKAREYGIAIMPLGAGGPGANNVAISPDKETLERFLREQGLEEVTAEKANEMRRVIRGTEADGMPMGGEHTLKGYMPFKMSSEPAKATSDWEKLGIKLPAQPMKVLYDEATGRFENIPAQAASLGAATKIPVRVLRFERLAGVPAPGESAGDDRVMLSGMEPQPLEILQPQAVQYAEGEGVRITRGSITPSADLTLADVNALPADRRMLGSAENPSEIGLVTIVSGLPPNTPGTSLAGGDSVQVGIHRQVKGFDGGGIQLARPVTAAEIAANGGRFNEALTLVSGNPGKIELELADGDGDILKLASTKAPKQGETLVFSVTDAALQAANVDEVSRIMVLSSDIPGDTGAKTAVLQLYVRPEGLEVLDPSPVLNSTDVTDFRPSGQLVSLGNAEDSEVTYSSQTGIVTVTGNTGSQGALPDFFGGGAMSLRPVVTSAEGNLVIDIASTAGSVINVEALGWVPTGQPNVSEQHRAYFQVHQVGSDFDTYELPGANLARYGLTAEQVSNVIVIGTAKNGATQGEIRERLRPAADLSGPLTIQLTQRRDGITVKDAAGRPAYTRNYPATVDHARIVDGVLVVDLSNGKIEITRLDNPDNTVSVNGVGVERVQVTDTEIRISALKDQRASVNYVLDKNTLAQLSAQDEALSETAASSNDFTQIDALPYVRDQYGNLQEFRAGTLDISVTGYENSISIIAGGEDKGGGTSFDDFQTPEIETADFSGRENITIAIFGNGTEARFELVSEDDKGNETKWSEIVTGIQPGKVQTVTVPLAKFAAHGVDLSRVRLESIIHIKQGKAQFVMVVNPSATIQLQAQSQDGKYVAVALYDRIYILPLDPQVGKIQTLSMKQVFPGLHPSQAVPAGIRYLETGSGNVDKIIEVTARNGEKKYILHVLHGGFNYVFVPNGAVSPDEQNFVFFQGVGSARDQFMTVHDVQAGVEKVLTVNALETPSPLSELDSPGAVKRTVVSNTHSVTSALAVNPSTGAVRNRLIVVSYDWTPAKKGEIDIPIPSAGDVLNYQYKSGRVVSDGKFEITLQNGKVFEVDTDAMTAVETGTRMTSPDGRYSVVFQNGNLTVDRTDTTDPRYTQVLPVESDGVVLKNMQLTSSVLIYVVEDHGTVKIQQLFLGNVGTVTPNNPSAVSMPEGIIPANAGSIHFDRTDNSAVVFAADGLRYRVNLFYRSNLEVAGTEMASPNGKHRVVQDQEDPTVFYVINQETRDTGTGKADVTRFEVKTAFVNVDRDFQVTNDGFQIKVNGQAKNVPFTQGGDSVYSRRDLTQIAIDDYTVLPEVQVELSTVRADANLDRLLAGTGIDPASVNLPKVGDTLPGGAVLNSANYFLARSFDGKSYAVGFSGQYNTYTNGRPTSISPSGSIVFVRPGQDTLTVDTHSSYSGFAFGADGALYVAKHYGTPGMVDSYDSLGSRLRVVSGVAFRLPVADANYLFGTASYGFEGIKAESDDFVVAASNANAVYVAAKNPELGTVRLQDYYRDSFSEDTQNNQDNYDLAVVAARQVNPANNRLFELTLRNGEKRYMSIETTQTPSGPRVDVSIRKGVLSQDGSKLVTLSAPDFDGTANKVYVTDTATNQVTEFAVSERFVKMENVSSAEVLLTAKNGREFILDLEENRIFSQTSVFDVNGDGIPAPRGVLRIINLLNAHGSIDKTHPAYRYVFDINRDGHISPIDVLMLINELNHRSSAEAEGEPVAVSVIDDSTDGSKVVAIDFSSGQREIFDYQTLLFKRLENLRPGAKIDPARPVAEADLDLIATDVAGISTPRRWKGVDDLSPEDLTELLEEPVGAASLGETGIIMSRADFLAELKAKGEFQGAVSGGARGHLNIIAQLAGNQVVAIEEYLAHYGGVAAGVSVNAVVRPWDGETYFEPPVASQELPVTAFGIKRNRIFMDAPVVVQAMADALRADRTPDEVVEQAYDAVTAASLGQGAGEALAYSEAVGRAVPASILEVAHDVTLDVYNLEGATAVVVNYYRGALGLSDEPEAVSVESEAVRAVNEGLVKAQDVLTHLGIEPPATRKPVILFVNEIFGNDDKKLSPEQVAAMAGKIAAGLNQGDLFVGVVEQDQNRLMAKLYEEAAKGQFRAKAMPQALLSDSAVESMAAKMDAAPIALSSLTDAGDAGLKAGNMTRIRFNKKAMKDAGMSLDWAVGLLEQIADNPEALRKLGLRPDSDGFWEAGSGFVALIERVYAEMKAQGKLATAA